MNRFPRDLPTDLGLMFLTVIWGVNFSVVKVVLREMDPLTLNALRFPLAALAFWLVLRRLPGPALPRREDLPRVLVLGLFGNVIYQLCFIIGLDRTFASNASLLLATTPVWTVAFSAWAGHESPTFMAMLGILVTVGGMVLVVGSGLGLGSTTLQGDALMILAAILWSLYTVGGAAPVARYGPLRVTAWTLWIATPAMVLAGVPSLARTSLGDVSAGAWLGIAYAGCLSVGLAYVLWYRGVQRLGNNRTAVYANLVPVAAMLTAWIWLGERPAALQWAGAVVILAGVALSRLTQSPGPSSLRWSSSGNS
jgi:drug/metabolite transporter (DMT)-like permease